MTGMRNRKKAETGARSARARIPSATYRVQMNSTFTFEQARELVEYWHTLGISDLYTSPYFRARPTSTHGYDIADHNTFNPAIGSAEQYDALAGALRARDMGVLLDVVPNHMGIGEPTNTWWVDVLENGPSSIYAPYFDIDWQPLKDELANKVLLPILGDQYGRVLERGELKVRYDDGAFYLDYWETELPVNPRTYVELLQEALPALVESLGDDHEDVLEFQSVITALTNLPLRTETDRDKVLERRREKEITKRRLSTLTGQSEMVTQAVARVVQQFNGRAGDPRSFDALDALIDRQAYRLAYWRVASEEINYRRFFDINELAAIRMERPEVFEATHQLLGDLIASGKVTGVRLDHPDGLWDPAGYFRNLQAYAAERMPREEGTEPPSADDCPLYVLVEKILGHGESLPDNWTVHGTTGYEFLNDATGVFVDASAHKQFTELFRSIADEPLRYDELVYTSKQKIMTVSLASEVNVLANLLARIAEGNRYFRDFTLYSLRSAIREVIACFTVYRTYIVADEEQVDERDRGYIDVAINRAKRRNPQLEVSIFDFIGEILKLNYPDTLQEEQREQQRRFVMKFQQLTGPVMAKGVEDTTFYIFNRLSSLNEVGGEPQRFGTSISAFHRHNQARARNWPHSMLASSTHDTKRSEDVRARITVLSELPKEWRTAFGKWARLNRRKKIDVDGALAPDRNEEYLLYQTLLGSWPTTPMDASERDIYTERIQQYMIKAIREAKVHTSWLNQNEAYDNAVRAFVAAVIADAKFVAAFAPLHAQVAHFGIFNALGQQLLKLTAPGVPDIYQGTEMLDFSLVDPDNRRPVDYDLRKWLLYEMRDGKRTTADWLEELLQTLPDGRTKLHLTSRTLHFRREYADLFRTGDYTPLEATGGMNDHIIAYARTDSTAEAITVVPRLTARLLGGTVGALPLGDIWGDAMLPLPDVAAGATYRNMLTDEAVMVVERDGITGVALAEVLASFPVALLAREEDV